MRPELRAASRPQRARAGVTSVTHLRRRAGIYLNRSRRSIWFHGGTVQDFVAAEGLVRRLRRRVSTDRFVFTSADRQACEWLRTRYPNDNALPVPFGFPPVLGRFFRQLNPRLLVRIGSAPGLPAGALTRAREAGIPVVPLPAGTADTAALDAVLERCFPRDALADPTAPRRMARLARTALGRAIVAFQGRRRLADWPALRQRLGRPSSILCLGNGPSSEDPRLADVRHDCLMRVNWRWLSRGLLTQPDMVFVGDLGTPHKLTGCVFGFRDVSWEAEVLLRQLVIGLSVQPLEHFTLERVASFVNTRSWGAVPTNGAVMIATAVGLEPDRLTIAGVDLYRHRAGRYPGDPAPDNDFPQMHDADVDLEVVAHALSGFRGEVVILSEPLRAALAERTTQNLRPG